MTNISRIPCFLDGLYVGGTKMDINWVLGWIQAATKFQFGESGFQVFLKTGGGNQQDLHSGLHWTLQNIMKLY